MNKKISKIRLPPITNHPQAILSKRNLEKYSKASKESSIIESEPKLKEEDGNMSFGSPMGGEGEIENRASTSGILPPIEYEVSNIEEAMKHKESTSIRDSQGALYPISTNIHTFGQFALGIELYFRFLKLLGYLFSLMTLIFLPSLLFNLFGKYLESKEFSRSSFLGRTTLANRKGISLVESDLNKAKDIIQNEEQYQVLTVYCDLIALLLFIIIVFKYLKWERVRIDNIIKQNITLSNYAIQFKGFPHNINPQEAKTWFENKFGRVIEITFARKFNGLLQLFSQKGQLDRDLAKEEILSLMNNLGKTKKLKELRRMKRDLEEDIEDEIPHLKPFLELPCLIGYVVFNTTKSKVACLRKYKEIQKYICCGYPTEYKLLDKHKINVSHADDPSNILWENLELSKCHKFFRSLVSILALIICLIICFCLIYWIKEYADRMPEFKSCIKYSDKSTAQLKVENNEDEIYCYCSQQSTIEIAQDNELVELCRQYLSDFTVIWVLRILNLFIISLINYALKLILRGLGKFERHSTKTLESLSIMKKLFTGCLFNMAILIILINADLKQNQLVANILNYISIGYVVGNGKYSDFDREWYLSVGDLIIIMMFINIFFPHILHLIKKCWYSCRIYCCKITRILQIDLNKAHEGPQFDLSDRYAFILVNVYIVFIYSSGIPIIIPMMALQLFLVYWIDKYLLLRFYKKPPYYGADLHNVAFSFLNWAILLHLILGIWIYGTPDIFPTEIQETEQIVKGNNQIIYVPQDKSVSERIYSNTSFPFMMGLIFYITFWMLKIFWTFLCSCFTKKAQIEDQINTEQRTFEELEEYMKKVYLTSYTMNANPEYSAIMESMQKLALDIKQRKQEYEGSMSEWRLNMSALSGTNSEYGTMRLNETVSVRSLRQQASLGQLMLKRDIN